MPSVGSFGSLPVLPDLVFMLMFGVELVALPLALGLALAPPADHPATKTLT
jgi:hypothetical protein